MNLLRRGAIGLAAMLVVFTGSGRAIAGSWLDGPAQGWNTPGAAVPAAPKENQGQIQAMCTARERAAAGPEERQVATAGWRLQDFWPAARQGSVTVLLASDSYDGMCRPLGFNAFAFMDGRFAGTLSPVAMNSRFDGALTSAPTLPPGGRVQAEFTRYAATDPLCCPSLPKTAVTYRFEAEAAGPVLVPEYDSGAPTAGTSGCQFVFGFKVLHDLVPQVVGDCIIDEQFNPSSGFATQQTAGVDGRGGLLVWRKVDGATAYTDGYRTWVLGPQGLQQRLNSERFSWERDRLTLDQLKNTSYRLPILRNEEVAFTLVNGAADLPTRLGRVFLIETPMAFVDLNGDGLEDVVVVLVYSGGGSGSFYYAVAVLNELSRPVYAGAHFLGDRVRLNGITTEGRKITVDLITQGPGEPLCCGTLRVDLSFILPR